MGHSYFENLLRLDKTETISQRQAQTLKEHLETCAACRAQISAWEEVDRLLQSSSQVTPRLGFSTRWQEHLAQELKYREKIQLWVAISIGMGGAMMILTMLTVWVWLSLGSPLGWFLTLISNLAEMILFISALMVILGRVGEVVPAPMWIGLGLCIFIFLSVVSCMWIVSMHKIFVPRRIET
jgi:predicted anti-sigma-YlaC factor YlaD